MIYLDTSTLAPVYWPESTSEEIQQIIARSGKPEISALGEVELFSAVSRRVRTRDLSIREAGRIIDQFSKQLRENAFVRHAVNHVHFQQAKLWISQLNTALRTLDALHLAVAAERQLRLVTADKALASAAKRFGVPASLVGN